MATSIIYFSGKAKWAQNLFEPDKKYNNYKVNLHLDEESLAKFVQSGLGLQIKEDEEMGPYIVLRRPVSKMIKEKIVNFSKPLVVEADGTTVYEGTIGNGSDITAKVTVYDTQKGKAHRLEAVKIGNLVEYHSEGDGDFPDMMEAAPF